MALDILGKLDELGIPYEEAEPEEIGEVVVHGYRIATNLTDRQIKAFYEYVSHDEDTIREYNQWVTEHPIKAASDLSVEWTEEDIEEHKISTAQKNRMTINVTTKERDDAEEV